MMRHGKQGTRELRNRISDLLNADNDELQKNTHHAEQVLHPQSEVEMLLPMQIGDYTDFYSSEQHAYNVGCLFRDPNNALLPNWKHIPVGYHGRASSIVPSGVDFRRPKGQKKPPTADIPVFGNCNLLDFELETAFYTYEGKPLGESISTKEADEYIFGMSLLNDWSARDIQGTKTVPMKDGTERKFINDHDTVIMRGFAEKDGVRIGFGEVKAKVLPAL
eukprot:maker-scaffold1171_size57388-snap-gene-0.2 protein:Tk11192 transcript:maker-scaffold1171_size57388-snap-gene-0.2-mRNA-1 annotation:"Fumarylacetoacetase"